MTPPAPGSRMRVPALACLALLLLAPVALATSEECYATTDTTDTQAFTLTHRRETCAGTTHNPPATLEYASETRSLTLEEKATGSTHWAELERSEARASNSDHFSEGGALRLDTQGQVAGASYQHYVWDGQARGSSGCFGQTSFLVWVGIGDVEPGVQRDVSRTDDHTFLKCHPVPVYVLA